MAHGLDMGIANPAARPPRAAARECRVDRRHGRRSGPSTTTGHRAGRRVSWRRLRRAIPELIARGEWLELERAITAVLEVARHPFVRSQALGGLASTLWERGRRARALRVQRQAVGEATRDSPRQLVETWHWAMLLRCAGARRRADRVMLASIGLAVRSGVEVPLDELRRMFDVATASRSSGARRNWQRLARRSWRRFCRGSKRPTTFGAPELAHLEAASGVGPARPAAQPGPSKAHRRR